MTNLINIQEIVNNKVESMLSDGNIVKTIESNIEKAIVSSLNDAVSSYSVSRVIKDKLESEITKQLADINLSAYTGKILNDICVIIEKESSKDFSERIKKTFSDLFLSDIPESISICNIAEKYADYLNEDLSDEDKPCDGYYARLTEDDDRYGLSYRWVTLKLKVEDKNERYSTHDSNNIEVRLVCNEKGSNLYKISSIYTGYNQDNIAKAVIHKNYSNIEKYLINLFLNDVKVEITEDDFGDLDCYSDVDY